MKLYKNRIICENSENEIISPELIIIHYTACSWERTKHLFEKGVVACHFLIDVDGSIDEIIPTLDTAPLKGRHAGRGEYVLSESNKWVRGFDFDKISLGIELVNFNGNLFEYFENQYLSIAELVKRLKQKFPKFKNPNRILGHEHIAFYRGKADPGHRFNWNRFYQLSDYENPFPHRKPLLPKGELIQLKEKIKTFEYDKNNISAFYEKMSRYTENLTKSYYDSNLI